MIYIHSKGFWESFCKTLNQTPQEQLLQKLTHYFMVPHLTCFPTFCFCKRKSKKIDLSLYWITVPWKWQATWTVQWKKPQWWSYILTNFKRHMGFIWEHSGLSRLSNITWVMADGLIPPLSPLVHLQTRTQFMEAKCGYKYNVQSHHTSQWLLKLEADSFLNTECAGVPLVTSTRDNRGRHYLKHWKKLLPHMDDCRTLHCMPLKLR